MNSVFLCDKKDIPDNGCKGFSLATEANDTGNVTVTVTVKDKDKDKERQDIFIVNRNGKYYTYKNSCPHTGATLNWQPDTFMDYDNFYIQCSIHAARFEVESGFCVWGPCVNQSLKKINIEINDDKIYLLEETFARKI